MRVIAGLAKGRKLKTIEGLATRPTTDRIKETLFNMIAFDLPGCKFLDLFSGSGSIGIEALSRGAAEVVFVDESALCQSVIAQNLAHTKLEAGARLLPMDMERALSALGNEKKPFDIIFIDPPYESGLAETALEKIGQLGLLQKDGYIIIERSAKIPLALGVGFCVLREKSYKTTVLTFLCGEEEAK